MIAAHAGQEPKRATEKPDDSADVGHHRYPKGAKLTGGDPSALKAILDRTRGGPRSPSVIAAPMFARMGLYG